MDKLKQAAQNLIKLGLKIERDLILFDTETTGVSTEKDRIVQIAVVKVKTNGEIETKELLVNPTVPIPQEASDVHGITDEMVADKPTFNRFAKSMAAYFEGCDIAGYNSDNFDIPIMSAEMERCGIDFPNPNYEYSLIDMLKIERLVNSHKLTSAYERYFGETFDSAHDAMNDVVATFEVFSKQYENPLIANLSVREIDELCQGNNKRFDIAGKMSINADGDVVWNFGKHIGKPVQSDLSYCDWFLAPKQEFPKESKTKLKNHLVNLKTAK